jgi:SulP family sulfate permease
MKDVRHIDTTGLLTLEGVFEHRRRRGHRTMLSAMSPGVRLSLERFGLIELVGRDQVFEATRDAIHSVPAPGGAAGE